MESEQIATVHLADTWIDTCGSRLNREPRPRDSCGGWKTARNHAAIDTACSHEFSNVACGIECQHKVADSGYNCAVQEVFHSQRNQGQSAVD